MTLPRPYRRQGVSFNPADAPEHRSRWHRLAIAEHRATHSSRETRTADRIEDAEALCCLLELPEAVTAAVRLHVQTWSEIVDLRTFARCGQGTVRAEAVVIATIVYCMTLMRVARVGAITTLLAAFTFRKGERHVTANEFDAAFAAIEAFFRQASASTGRMASARL